MSAPAAAKRFQLASLSLDQPARRDIGLIILSMVVVGAAYFVTSESSALATGTALGLSTAAGMHARLAMGRMRAAIQIVGTAAALSALGAPARLVGVLLITGLAAGSISVLTWPPEQIVAVPLAAATAMMSPFVTGFFLDRTGVLFRELGKNPPSMFAARDAMIFALGLSLMRVVILL